MLYASKLPKNLWSAAVKAMAYLHNRSPAHANHRITLFEHIPGSKPDLAHLKIFGSPVSVAIPKEKRKNGIQDPIWATWWGVRALAQPDYFLFCLCFPYMDSLVVCPN